MSGRLSGRVAAAIFASQLALLDLSIRGLGAYAAHPRALVNAAESVALWSLLGAVSARRGPRAAVAFLAAASIVLESLFARYYHTALDAQILVSAMHAWSDVRPIVWRMLPRATALVAIACVIEYAVLAFAVSEPSTLPARRRRSVTLFVALALFAAPAPLGTPELRLVQSLGRLVTPAQAATIHAPRLPSLDSTRRELPSVLVIVTESVGAASYCNEPSAACAVSPEVNAILPLRTPLRQMRAVASYTTVSVSALITGLPQTGPRRAIAGAPDVFDFARAVRGGGERLTVAYWSSQSETIFERNDVRGAVDSFVSLETLLGRTVDDEDDVVDRGVDRLLAAHVLAALPSLAKPCFLVLHFSGTHAPYFVDEADAPFRPWSHEVAWSKMEELRNAYKNAIHEQDKSIAASIRAFIAHQGASPFVILFTSDHGEAFGEHGGIHHGQSLYDDQIHVPAWAFASRGAIGDEERDHLAAHADAFITHLDVLPTILDVFGVLDHFAVAPYRAKLAGQSLLALPPPPSAKPLPTPITNCTPLFPCPVNTWGMLQGDRAILAQAWDGGWRCIDLRTGDERSAATDRGCLELERASRPSFPLLPNGQPNEPR